MRTILMLLCSMISVTSFASEGVTSVGGHLTRAEFQKKVDTCITILKATGALTVEEAVLLVRVSNTFYRLHIVKTNLHAEDTKGKMEFDGLMGRSAVMRLGDALGDWIPNRGMGIYYKKYDLHYGGAPGNIRDRDSFDVDDKP